MIGETLSGKARDRAEGQNHISEDIKEFRESKAGGNNIIILNVNESKSTEAEARKQEDTDYVQELCGILKVNHSSVKTMARLASESKKGN